MASVRFSYENQVWDTVPIEEGKSTYQSIAQKLSHNLPDEFTVIIEQQSDTIISKYNTKYSGKSYLIIPITQLHEQVKTLEKNLSQEKEDRQSNNQDKLKLEERITSLKALLTNIQTLSSSSDDQAKMLQEEKEKVPKQLDDVKKIFEVFSKKDNQLDNSSLLLSIYSFASQNCCSQYFVQCVNSVLAKMQINLKESEKNGQVQKDQILQLNNSVYMWQQYCITREQQFKQNYDNLVYQWQVLKSENEALKQQIEQLENSLNKEKSETKKQIEEIKKKQKELSGMEEETEKLKFEHQKAYKQVKQANSLQVKKLQDQLLDQQSQYQEGDKSRRQDLDRKGIQINQLKKEIQELKEAQKEPLSNKEPLKDNQKLQALVKQLNEAKQINDSQYDEIRNLKSELKRMTSEKQMLEGKLNVMEDEQKFFEINKQQLEQQIQSCEQQRLKVIELIKIESEESDKMYDEKLRDLDNAKTTNDNNWRQKQQQSEQEIQRLNEKIAKLLDEKKQIKEEAKNTRKKFQKQILDFDSDTLMKDQQIKAIENSSTWASNSFRIARLVESIPRDYAADIEFAIETMMRTKVKCDDFLKVNVAQCKQQKFILSKVNFKRNDLQSILFNVSDLNFVKYTQKVYIGEIQGNRCFKPIDCSDSSLDRSYFFKCSSCPKMKELEGKVFAIKEYTKGEIQDSTTEQTAIENCLATLLAEEMLDSFITELAKKNVKNIPQNLKFQKQFIIQSEKHFKQVFDEEVKRQQLVNPTAGFKFFITLISMLEDEQSDDLNNDIRVFQLNKERNKNQKKEDGISVLKGFITTIDEPLKSKIKDIQDKHDQVQINKGFDYLLDFLGVLAQDMPQKIYYSMQQIDIVDGFKKYNGGHMKFEVDPLGKFFSAFSYYSIIKSQRQICVSHLQGAGNQLYDPLVSTYDGFLDKLDQGYNEIKTIESKFLSEPNYNKGVDFLQPLGIKWK